MQVSFFSDLLEAVTDRGRRLLNLGGHPGAGPGPSLADLAEALLSGRGEASGVAIARSLLDGYQVATLADRAAFLTALAERFGPDRAGLARAIAAHQMAPDDETAVSALHRAAEPRRQELIRRLNLAPGGTAALVRMREDLLELLPDRPDLRMVDMDFVHLFSSWFNRGFLVLRPIDWTTPANILEKIIRYEAVHAIETWDDLRNRLEPLDRRCYGFFHPQLVDEPLIFVEVALTREMPAAVAPLLDLSRTPIAPGDATTAVFYSISNTQRGLGGVSFGNFLIKQVVENLKRELPNLRTFVTLSPVPAFAAWLAAMRESGERPPLDPADMLALAGLDQPDWYRDDAARARLHEPLLAAAAHYFLEARTAGGRPLDPVARFHLGNGASLERINVLGDLSTKALQQSHGLMVNYLYALDEIETNHELFAEKGVVAASSAVRKALRTPVRDPLAGAPAG